MATNVRVGLLGFGHGGEIFHAPLIHATAGMSLAAVVTSDPDRRARVARDYPGARVVAIAAELWDHAADLDLAVVATPNISHAPLALEALAAGLHVVIDKPMAATAADARRVLEEAASRKRLLTVFQNRRWDGDFLTVRNLIERGALGDVWRFESRFERWRPAPRGGWRENPDRDQASGVLYDLGTHIIDQALVLFGDVAHIDAEVDRRRPGFAVADDVCVTLTHGNGVRSRLWASLACAQPGPRFRVLGSKAGFTKYGLDVQEDSLRAGARPGHPGWGEDAPERYGVLGADDALEKVPTEAGAYQEYYAAVARAIRDGGPLPVDPQDAVTTLEIIEAAIAQGRKLGLS